jgi:alpha-beta hydrolase superfamily lysophospholipase
MLTRPPRQPDHATPHRRLLLAVGSLILGAVFLRSSRKDHRAACAAPRYAETDGIGLAIWQPPAMTGAVIVGVHAFGDYHMAFAETAGRLTCEGHVVVAYDQPGFGATDARGAYASDETYRSHLSRVVEFARRRFPGSPVIVMGESFGATVALISAAYGDIQVDGMILSGPGVRENVVAKPFWDALLAALVLVLGSRPVRMGQGSAGMSEAARRRFDKDPLVMRDIRADTYSRVVGLADAASVAAHKVGVPTLVLYGARDWLIPRRCIDALMRRLGRHGRLRVYQDMPHLVLQAQHRAEVEKDILAYLGGLATQ